MIQLNFIRMVITQELTSDDPQLCSILALIEVIILVLRAGKNYIRPQILNYTSIHVR